jgi:hypothetical protein
MKKCCDVFNEVSKEVLETKAEDVTFCKLFEEERAAGESGKEIGLWVVSSRFACEFQTVFARFSKVLYSGVARLPPEECLHHVAQFYEAISLMQSHHGRAAKHQARWAEEETLGNLIGRVSGRNTFFMTENQAKTHKLLTYALSRFCRSIVLALMRVAYAEDRNSQSRFIRYCFFLMRDIIEETLRSEECEREATLPTCCLL